MDRQDEQDAQAASTKPVSSLRSQFESLASSRSSTPGSANVSYNQKPSTLTASISSSLSSFPTGGPLRPTVTVPDAQSVRRADRLHDQVKSPQVVRSSRPRPVSMLSSPSRVLSPSSDIKVINTSPPRQQSADRTPDAAVPQRSAETPEAGTSSREMVSPPRQVGARSSRSLAKLSSSTLNALDVAAEVPRQFPSKSSGMQATSGPPKINRAAKPQIPAQGLPGFASSNSSCVTNGVAAAGATSNLTISSDSTVDRNHGSSIRPAIPSRSGNDSGARLTTKPLTTYNDRPVSRVREEDTAPALPPRHDTSAPKISANSGPALELPPRPSALTQGFSSRSSQVNAHSRSPLAVESTSSEARPQPIPIPVRLNPKASDEMSRPRSSPRNLVPGLTPPSQLSYSEDKRRRPISPANASNASVAPSEMPNSSCSNRQPPTYPDGPRLIASGYDAKLLDVCGEYVCTSGTLTRVWNVLSGKLLLSLAQAEHVKVTAMAFKPARNLDEEGTRLWLGTNWGEVQEIDIPSKKIIATNATVHNRREITRIHRHAAELWSIDEEGKLYIWPPDISGSPNLEVGIQNPKLPRGRSTSLIVGSRLWYICGKDIRVFAPSTKPGESVFQLSDGPFSQANLGDVTSSAILSTQPDHVFFGHSHGRITVYSRKDFKLRRVVHVANHKVTCLVGASSHLWVGLNTGKICVYDTASKPCAMKTAWQTHTSPITSLVVDRSSIWKLSRLQVLSLSMDNTIGIWDGMLEDDWLDNDLRIHQEDYCTFRDATALVVTWNAGASTPADLRYEDRDRNFFREIVHQQHSPDIVMFGLQELVDLEDKALTAKSFFKSRSKDPYGQEQLSSVYRAWRDHFTRCLGDGQPVLETYTLCHTASLVGLFTCVFVKSSQSSRYRNIQSTEVKTGMGGLHGNKGALLVRLTCDDSSLCFVNCHLAAGQTQTANRNQDVSAILEHPHLSPLMAPETYPEVCVSGGDGSMVVDYELCVLNGDLNYRLDAVNRETITAALKANNLGKLLDRDQLLLSQKRNPSFYLRNFDEGQIDFHPTYKYDVGTDVYDTSEKRRSPAWCDRVLFRGGDKIKQLDYRRHEVRVSDHRPVSSLFTLKIKTVQRDKRAQCWQSCVARYEKFKSHVATQAKLDYLTNVFGLSPAEAKRRLEA